MINLTMSSLPKNELVDDLEVTTTNGVIALANLQAQIDGLTSQMAEGRLTVPQGVDFVDLLILRGQILGRIADYELAEALAEHLVQEAPVDGSACFARAKTRALFHRFAEALADLDAAARLGVDGDTLEAERATIYQALGRYDEALALRRGAVEQRPDFATLGALAGLHAERGEVAEAESLFSDARRRTLGVSPFPVALLDFQHGLMWMEQDDLNAARAWFNAAQRRLPAFAPAVGHLAEVDIALGNGDAAVSGLRSLTAFADDPEYVALLAGLLSRQGQREEARQWRRQAAARYDELMMRHPAAFADHAAEFWLTTGDDVERALQLAGENLAMRQTPRAYALFQRVALAHADQ